MQLVGLASQLHRRACQTSPGFLMPFRDIIYNATVDAADKLSSSRHSFHRSLLVFPVNSVIDDVSTASQHPSSLASRTTLPYRHFAGMDGR